METVRALLRDRSGAIAIVLAGLLPLLVGMAGLGIEAGLWFADHRRLQNAADAAAIGAAFEIKAGRASQAAAAAAVDAGRNGFSAAGGATLTVNAPPATGPHAGRSGVVEVVLTRPEPVAFASLFRSALTLSARAVASAGGSDSCILSLDTAAAGAFSMTGSGALTLSGCGLAVDSASASAVQMTGSGSITADFLQTPGDVRLTGSARLNVGRLDTGAAAVADPFADLAIPAAGACTHTNFSVMSSQTLSPGVYCNGLSVVGSGTYTLAPGTYFISGGSFSITGSATLSGTGVTIVLTGSPAATFSMTGSGRLTLRAPTSGPLAGLAIVQDRSASTSGSSSVTGSATVFITGAVYLPRQSLTFTGSNGASGCTWLVARQVRLTGSVGLGDSCAGTGLDSYASRLSLLE